jgi:hypothetical protein
MRQVGIGQTHARPVLSVRMETAPTGATRKPLVEQVQRPHLTALPVPPSVEVNVGNEVSMATSLVVHSLINHEETGMGIVHHERRMKIAPPVPLILTAHHDDSMRAVVRNSSKFNTLPF